VSVRISSVVTLAFAAPVVYLYLSFLSWLLSNGVLAGASPLELLLLLAQVVTLAAVMLLKRLRRASVGLIADLFSLEVFAFPVLGGLYLYYGNQSFLSQALAVMTAWPAALICVVPVFVIYKLVSIMRNGGRLVHLVPPAVAFFALLAFVASATSSVSAPVGLAGLSQTLFSYPLHAHSIAITPQVEVAGIPTYVTLLVYAATQGAGGISTGRNSALLLALVGTLIAICLAFLAAYVEVDPLLAFGVPGSVILTVIWWIARAH